MKKKRQDITISNSDRKKIGERYIMVIFLDYVRRFAPDHAFSWPRYFYEELGIFDVTALENSALRQGYLSKKSGRYVLTSKGEKFADTYEDYLRFFDLAIDHVDISEFETAKENIKGDRRFEAVMITLLLGKIKESRGADDFRTVREFHLETARLYEALGMIPQAVYHYLCYIYFQVSGIEYYDRFVEYINRKISRQELADSYKGVYLSIDIIKKIREHGDIYYDDMSDRVFQEYQLTMNLCTGKDFKSLIGDVISGEYKNVPWQQKFKENYAKLMTVADKKQLENR